MLTGRPAVEGRNVLEILHHAANEPISPPSKLNPEVDDKLDDLVLKALASEPERRYASAEEMEQALRDYLDPAASPDGPGAEAGGTLEFLLRRMRHKSDFPALANTISTINRVTDSVGDNASALSNTILKDFALTNKLLRLVNTAYFGQYGGTISTVSRAVAILGFGANVDEIIRKGFAIPISGSRDVFQAAIANGADILIEDADELALLKTLRNQAVLAVRQHSS